jgi:thiol-disulfide isomerase/thioredoxin
MRTLHPLRLTALLFTCLPLYALGEDAKVGHPMPTAIARLPVEGMLPNLDKAVGWLNSPPLRPADLRGKVVLVDFWTYTCINWRRTAPYLRAWSKKYADHGLVVIGVHTPEFTFEKDVANVRRAVKELAIDYPVAIDSNYGVWDAFNNNYWPAAYFVDAQGRIRHHQFGEGDYEKLELVIRQLLTEAGQRLPAEAATAIVADGAEVAANFATLGTPETYFGYARADTFAPANRKPMLSGKWSVMRESAVGAANAKITMRFHARDVHLVMGPGSARESLRFRVTLSGQPPGGSHGTDIDATGMGTLDGPRMYQLIRQPDRIDDQQIEIEFLDAGAEIFAFTFG